MPGNAPIQSLQRAARVLFAVAGADEGRSIAQIAAATGLRENTAYKFIRTLEQEKLLKRREHPLRFLLGPAIAELKRLDDDRRLLSLAGRVLVRAQARMPDANLVLLEAEGPDTYQRLGVFAERPGVLARRRDFKIEPYLKASSLLFLAFAPEPVAREFFQRHPFARHGARHWKNRDALDAFLAEVRRSGHAQPAFPDLDDARRAIFRLAVPVFDADRAVVAAVGGFISDEVPRARKLRLLRLCKETAAEIAAGLKTPAAPDPQVRPKGARDSRPVRASSRSRT